MRLSRKSQFYILFSAIIAALLMTAPAQAKKTETGFLDRTADAAGTEYKYQVFVPENWTEKQKWPVILFLHGAGERGDDGLIQTEVGIGTAIRRYRDRFPAVIVIPQCRKNVWWSESTMADMAMAALAAAQREFHGDAARTYLTGLSMGGYGTWYLAGKYPGKFAAIVPICGGILMPDIARAQSPDDNTPYTETARKIGGKTPIWIFHGGDDPVVPVTESRRMNDAMKALGGEVHYTEYPGVGHNSWEKAYAEPDLLAWMLSKTTGASSGK
ncbi:MAG TPA: prolyl oligopeptidase family serine peptidase [Candidatus Acidoferrum sp.]|nr:prolyl oligopeptidase family serine peptidase [Candidatus Acidoferrum sp.]